MRPRNDTNSLRRVRVVKAAGKDQIDALNLATFIAMEQIVCKRPRGWSTEYWYKT